VNFAEGPAGVQRVREEAIYRRRRLVLQPGRGIEQPHHFLHAEHHRQLARLVNDMGMLDDLVAFSVAAKNMLRWADMKSLLDTRGMV
jgi:hypothetical protein